MIDTHSHCLHSHDGQFTATEMIEQAVKLGLNYYALTDHCDKDCAILPEYSWVKQMDVDNHFNELNRLKKIYKDRLDFAVGIECGFYEPANNLYKQILDKYYSDIIINSVHIVEKEDVYFQSYFEARGKHKSYADYFKAVRESLDVPYPYDVVGHIGYIARKAPFVDKSFGKEFDDQLDDILKTIVTKGKALEINSNGKGTGNDFIPTRNIIERFIALGGEYLTFGSDAHTTDRICDKYNMIKDYLLSINVKYVFGYLNHKPIPYKL